MTLLRRWLDPTGSWLDFAEGATFAILGLPVLAFIMAIVWLLRFVLGNTDDILA